MTEEIINVKNCGYYKEGDCLVCPVNCEEYIDCDYKTIFRLKQENEAINKDLLTERQENAELATENYKFRKALEEIREIAEPRFVNSLNEEADLCNLAMDRITNKINEVLK